MGNYMAIFEIVGLILGGGATGLFGTIANRLLNYVDERQRFAHELNLLRLQAEIGSQEREQERLIMEGQAATALKIASYDHDTGYGKGSRWVVNTLRLFRPVLTLMLLLGVFIAWIFTTDPTLQQQLVGTLIYLATVALTWWFGDRGQVALQQSTLPWRR